VLPVPFLLLLAALCLTAGQSWALEGRASWARHLIVFAIVLIPFLALELPPNGRQSFVEFFLTAGVFGMLVFSALIVGGWRARAKRLLTKDWRTRIVSLIGIHMIIVFIGGMCALWIAILLMLSRIH
jgi:hypothetical protein